jgi:hypothetical protein
MRCYSAVTVLAAAAWLTGCSASDGGDATPGLAAVPGTAVAFDLGADTSVPAHFYDAPFPSDLRLTSAGRSPT